MPKILKSKKDTIGLRVPDNEIARTIIRELGRPILSASLPGEMVEEYTDPEYMHDNFKKLVDLVVDGGIGGMIPSTIVDCTEDEPVIIRQGLGEWNGWKSCASAHLKLSKILEISPASRWRLSDNYTFCNLSNSMNVMSRNETSLNFHDR